MIDPPSPEISPPPSCRDLFLCFLAISLLGVGGGITAWIWQQVVIRRRWIDERKFVGGVALSQMVPGANAVNLAVYVGTSLRGAPGAVAALAGLMGLPLVVLLGLGSLYFAVNQYPVFHSALAGMAAGSIGLNFAIGCRLIRAQPFNAGQLALIVAIVVVIGYLRYPLLPTVAVVIPASLVLALLTTPAGKS